MITNVEERENKKSRRRYNSYLCIIITQFNIFFLNIFFILFLLFSDNTDEKNNVIICYSNNCTSGDSITRQLRRFITVFKVLLYA